MALKEILNNSVSLVLSFLLLIFFSAYQINFENLWFDEISTFWITNPDITDAETYKNIIKYEKTPFLYYQNGGKHRRVDKSNSNYN